MRERPILFNGAMVTAILAGQKTQTRRVVKPAPPAGHTWAGWCGYSTARADEGKAVWAAGQGPLMIEPHRVPCPFGQPGDRLWVRESFRVGEDLGKDWEHGMEVCDRFPIYQADGQHGRYGVVPLGWDPPRNAREVHNSEGTTEHWRSFGPIPCIHMPRWACRLVLEITAVRVERLQAISAEDCTAEGISTRFTVDDGNDDLRLQFRDLWTSTGGDWDSDPWVWVVEFKKVIP